MLAGQEQRSVLPIWDAATGMFRRQTKVSYPRGPAPLGPLLVVCSHNSPRLL